MSLHHHRAAGAAVPGLGGHLPGGVELCEGLHQLQLVTGAVHLRTGEGHRELCHVSRYLQCGIYSVVFTVWYLQCVIYSVVFTEFTAICLLFSFLPSQSDIDIIVDCFSVNHGLSVFLFDVLVNNFIDLFILIFY